MEPCLSSRALDFILLLAVALDRERCLERTTVDACSTAAFVALDRERYLEHSTTVDATLRRTPLVVTLVMFTASRLLGYRVVRVRTRSVSRCPCLVHILVRHTRVLLTTRAYVHPVKRVFSSC
ncbi:hypothetical protein NDU88_010321 [Pleurodeles waltl]|uniref:Secreted protein n=1 Tax=Pleurodeles waltl TaxID=8319 RepID=A0AAV7QYD0_PLEWA|nr:hypothetical protein NDU88_010321 [Pleurodeles waltl]